MGNELLLRFFSIIKTTLRYVVFFFVFLLFSLSCSPTEPKIFNEELQLQLEDVPCTEAWVTLSTGKLELPTEITIYRNTVAQNIILCYGDTLLFIDSLFPSQTYTIQAIQKQQEGNQQPVTSNKITLTTMDTTSSNFTWQVWSFGAASSSTLYDVAIIYENNIWVVGEFFLLDSLGRPEIRYNAIVWDGFDWTPKKIEVQFRGYTIMPPLEGIVAFSDTDIWLIGSLPISGDGKNWIMHDLRTTVDPGLSLSKGWGTSSNNMSFVRRAGSIAHWNGNKWIKIESGTNLLILGIHGSLNPFNGKYEIFGTAHQVFIGTRHYFFEIDKNIAIPQNIDEFPDAIKSVWYLSGRKYYAVGDGLFYSNKIESGWKSEPSFPIYSVQNIRGNGFNDIVAGGHFGLLAHYNGVRWTHFDKLDMA